MNRIPPFRDALFIVFTFALVSFFSFAQTVELTPLVTGEIIEREISATQKHFYKVRLEAGQFVKMEVLPNGCDLALGIYDLNEKTTLDLKNENALSGVETVVAAVKQTGEYQVRVISTDKGDLTKSYRLRIIELRSADEKEFSYTDGKRIMSEMEVLIKSDSSFENIQNAIKKYQEAVEKFKVAGAKKPEGVALDNIGILFTILGNRRKSAEYHQKSLEIFRAIGDKKQQSFALNSLGRTYSYLGERQKALEILGEALNLAKEAKNKKSEGITLNGIGAIYSRLKDSERAESYHIAALKIFEELQDVYNQSVTQNYLGNCAGDKTNYKEAAEYYEKAVNLLKTLPERQMNSNYLSNLSSSYFQTGNIDKSFEYLNEALNLSQKQGDKPDEALFLQRFGKSYLKLGKEKEASEFLEKSLQIYRLIEDPNNLAETLFLIAQTKKRLGKLDEAQTYLEEALQLIESFRMKINVNELRDSFSVGLYEYYNAYTELLMKRHFAEPSKNFAELAWQATERGRARNLLNLLNEANAEIEQGVEPKLLERERELSGLLNVRLENLTRFLSGKHDVQKVETLKKEIEQIRIEYQILQGQIREQSPHYAALKQPQTLSLKEVQTQILDSETVLLSYSLGAEKSYLWLITKDNFQVFNLPKREEIESKARNFYNLLTARNKKIKFETPAEKDVRIARADEDFPEVAQELSQILLGGIENQIGSKRLLIVADGALQYIPFASLTSPKSKVQSPKSEPPALAGGQNAAKNPSQIKLQTPETGNRFLIETNEIVNLPSISALAILRRETLGRKIAPKTIAVLADPVFETTDERFSSVAKRTKNFNNLATTREISFDDLSRSMRDSGEESAIPRLPFTRREAEAVSALVPKNQRKISLDFSATRQIALSEEMNQYRIIHLATHGFINSKNPELSGLVFSLIDENGAPQNGFLRTDEIFNLKLSADLVVLSGCKTGLGKEIRGEGLIGMTRGFMYAGASRLVVSLWDVNDESTAEYMQKFYQAMLGKETLSPAAALRSAQITMLKNKRWQHPYFWSTFVIQGEPL